MLDSDLLVVQEFDSIIYTYILGYTKTAQSVDNCDASWK